MGDEQTTRPDDADGEAWAGGHGSPPPARDPRLEIPEVLRTPVKRPSLPSDPKPVSTVHPGAGGMTELAKALSLGFDFLFIIASGGLLGWLFDRWRGTGNLGVVIGLGVGFIAGTARLLQRLNRDDKPTPKGRPGSPSRSEPASIPPPKND